MLGCSKDAQSSLAIGLARNMSLDSGADSRLLMFDPVCRVMYSSSFCIASSYSNSNSVPPLRVISPLSTRFGSQRNVSFSNAPTEDSGGLGQATKPSINHTLHWRLGSTAGNRFSRTVWLGHLTRPNRAQSWFHGL